MYILSDTFKSTLKKKIDEVACCVIPKESKNLFCFTWVALTDDEYNDPLTEDVLRNLK